MLANSFFCENLQFGASLHHLSEIFIDVMCVSLFSYCSPVVVRCMGVGLGMGWVGSWVHKFTWQWVELGWICMSVGCVGSWVMKMDPWTTLNYLQPIGCSVEAVATMIGCLPTQAIAFGWKPGLSRPRRRKICRTNELIKAPLAYSWNMYWLYTSTRRQVGVLSPRVEFRV